MPPPPPAPNMLHFPDLPSAARALRTPALLQNNGNSQLTFSSITKEALQNHVSLPQGTQFDLSAAVDNSKNIIAQSYDSSFKEFLGECMSPSSVVPPFDETLPPPQSVITSVPGALLLSY